MIESQKFDQIYNLLVLREYLLLLLSEESKYKVTFDLSKKIRKQK